MSKHEIWIETQCTCGNSLSSNILNDQPTLEVQLCSICLEDEYASGFAKGYGDKDRRKEIADEATRELTELLEEKDTDTAHSAAYRILCATLHRTGLGQVAAAFAKVDKWYS